MTRHPHTDVQPSTGQQRGPMTLAISGLKTLASDTWTLSSPSATRVRSPATTPSSTAGARCSCCPARSGPASRGRGSRWSSDRTGTSQSVITVSRSPLACLRRRPAGCAPLGPNWPAIPITSGSSPVEVRAAPYPARPPMGPTSAQRPTAPSTAARCDRPLRANSPAGRRSSRPSCKACRCGRPPVCSGSLASP